MKKIKKPQKLFIKFFVSILIIFILLALMFFGLAKAWNFKDILLNFFGNLAVSIVGTCLSLLIYTIQLKNHLLDDENLEISGIKNYGDGYQNIFDRDNFFSLQQEKDKTIDIFGMAMYGFFDTFKMVSFLCEKAKEGYQIRVFFANPESEELKKQEKIEDKLGRLQADIKKLTDQIQNEIKKNESIEEKIDVYHLGNLPRAFILRAGDKMIVTNYLYKGPKEAPAMYIENNRYKNSMFQKYMEYIEESLENSENKSIEANVVSAEK